jgi:hypothetical protein
MKAADTVLMALRLLGFARVEGNSWLCMGLIFGVSGKFRHISKLRKFAVVKMPPKKKSKVRQIEG